MCYDSLNGEYANQTMMKQIIPGLYTFTGLILGRVYAIEDPDGLTIIDAGMPIAAARVCRQIEAAGRKRTDVKRILITHGHADHIGGLPALAKATGAPVWAASIERPVIEGREPPATPPKERLRGVSRLMAAPPALQPGTPVDREIGEGDVLSDVMGGLHVLHTPGHAPGHLAFWQPERRVLFCGDVMMNLAGVRLPFRAYTVDMEEDIRSIQRLAALEAATVCFGHGPPLTRNTAARITSFAERVAAKGAL